MTIGNFDGVHRGHAALVAAARRAVGTTGTVVAVTFEPHPMVRLRPQSAPPRLTRADVRRSLLMDAGCDDVIEMDPSPELLALDPHAFIANLRRQLPFDVVVEGSDFRFGRQRAGSVETLRELGARLGFTFVEVPPIDIALNDRTLVCASSSVIRWLVSQGRVRDAAALLGRPYTMTGVSIPGDRRGRAIGFPTLNLGPTEQQLPMDGVYGGFARLPDGSSALAALSVGTKPTFGQSARTCEAHLVDTHLPLDWYGAEMAFSFLTWIREQRSFASLDGSEGLLERIRADIREIRERLPPLRGAHVAASTSSANITS
ncbi:MAG: riboflavin kinase [Phycisphaerae bacterium]|nr:riboflavin kinase [Phycisphaerae bacterium]